MHFVLSVVHPPEGEAKYGKAWVSTPQHERRDLRTPAHNALRKANPFMPIEQASRYAGQIVAKDPGVKLVEGSTGLRFRIDKVDDRPHPCSCCGGLVLPSDYPEAHNVEGLCRGCIQWSGTLYCLPKNTAHSNQKS